MIKLFRKIISEILVNKTQHSKETQRYQSIFKKSKEKEHQLLPYIILKATKDDFYPILQLMHESYYPDEPTCASLGISHNAVLDESAMKDMAEGMTLVARCKYDGCIVGACINGSTHPWDPEMKEKLACSVKCPKVRQLLLFYAHIQRVPDIWNIYSIQKVFEMIYLFIKKEHRHKGIACRLINESRSLAADCGFNIVRVDATSNHSAQLLEKMNMKLLAEVPYCSYLGKNLEPVFNPPHPHNSVKIYVDETPHLKKSNKKKRQ